MKTLNTEVCRQIIESLLEIPEPTRESVNKIKLETAGALGLARVVPNSEIITCLRPDERSKLLHVLKRKETRTISGVTIVAVMTRPWPCPHNTPCVYCPGGPDHNLPQSYTGYEPAAMRGAQNRYDPYMQVRSRIEQLRAIGHTVDKVELIVMGGTFPSAPSEYQMSFIKGCLDAVIGAKTQSLEEAKRLAETARIRNIGITVETRPDWAGKEQVNQLLSMGVTRVELGVQTLANRVYDLIKRRHTVEDVVEATRVLKDAGMKVVYHLMPGLPGSCFKADLEGFKKVFFDADFKPDMIKIYPCLVLGGTELFKWWKDGTFNPYSTEEAVRFITEIKKFVPPWVRIMRVQRDIPAQLVEAGVKESNLRQLAMKRLASKGIACRCIRCREVGHKRLRDRHQQCLDHVEVLSTEEEASGGVDVFLSAEDSANDILIGYLRLRMPSYRAHRPEIVDENASIVRELHVCGALVPVGEHTPGAWQHKGYGGALLEEAERKTEEYGKSKVVIISGLGAKRYFKRRGYRYDGPYMSKTLE